MKSRSGGRCGSGPSFGGCTARVVHPFVLSSDLQNSKHILGHSNPRARAGPRAGGLPESPFRGWWAGWALFRLRLQGGAGLGRRCFLKEFPLKKCLHLFIPPLKNMVAELESTPEPMYKSSTSGHHRRWPHQTVFDDTCGKMD